MEYMIYMNKGRYDSNGRHDLNRICDSNRINGSKEIIPSSIIQLIDCHLIPGQFSQC